MVTQGLEEKQDACTSAVLHRAASGGHEETLTLLPSSSAPATTKDSNGLTPLMRASRRGHLDVVQTLLQSLETETLEERDAYGKTALYHAAAGGREGVLACLLSHGAQANGKTGHGMTPLMRASLRGHLCVVQKLLQALGSEGLEERDVDGRTALYHAAAEGHDEVLACLLSHGAQANCKNGHGMTPLTKASSRGHLRVVQKLLPSLGAEGLEERDACGRTALYHAAAEGHEKVVALLLSRGVQPHSAGDNGGTPLIAACSRGHMGVVHLLLQHVGQQGLEERSKKGWTALLHAVAGGHEKVVAALLSHGARANSKDGKGKTPLMTAAMKGHLGVVQTLLQVVGYQGLEARDADGWTALHYAVDKGHEEVVAFLLSNGARANSEDGNGVTPLMTASSRSHLSVVQQLLQVVGNSGLEARDKEGWTALHLAVDGGHEEVVKFLLSRGAQAHSKDDEGVTPLMQASLQGSLGVVQQLLQVVGDQGLEEQDKSGWTALQYAVDGDHEEVVKLLLSHGAQANSKDGESLTALMRASFRGQLCVVQTLVEVVGNQGLADRDGDGSTALHYAADKGHDQVVAFLLSKGAQANSKDGKGVTPLVKASWRGHLSVVQQLLQIVGAKGLEERDKDGWTALHFAVDGDHAEVVKFLVSKGAQANSKDGEGLTPLMYASSEGQLCVVQTLVEVVGKPGLEEEDQDGRTALHHAAEGGHAEVMSCLLSHGAQANSKDGQGKTPLMVASWGGHLCGVLKLHEVVGNQGLADMDEDGWTALHHAADGGHDEVVKVLLSNGAQANSKDEGDMTPLMHASSEGHLGVVQTLVEVIGPAGQGLEERDNDGWTALHFAAAGGNEEIIKFLVSHGARANSKDGRGKTPLMQASLKGHIGVAQQLHQVVGDQGLADMDEQGWTALHFAASRGHKEVVVFLLSRGAQVQSSDSGGNTPLMLACMNHHLGVVQALLRHTHVQGLNASNADGRTALHLACVTSYLLDKHKQDTEKIVRALLLAGADPTVVDDEGETPRAFAEADGDAEVVSVFEWWEAELERPYLLHRAKCLSDVYMRQQVAPPIPAYLRARALPRVEVGALQQEHEGTVGRKASAEARGTQEGEEERHAMVTYAMVTYAMNEMNEQLYIELLEGFHGPTKG